MHGDRDDGVPYEHGKQVFTAANLPKDFYPIKSAKHNDTHRVDGAVYFAHLGEFVDMALAHQR